MFGDHGSRLEQRPTGVKFKSAVWAASLPLMGMRLWLPLVPRTQATLGTKAIPSELRHSARDGPPRCYRRLVGRAFLRFLRRQDAGSILESMESPHGFDVLHRDHEPGGYDQWSADFSPPERRLRNKFRAPGTGTVQGEPPRLCCRSLGPGTSMSSYSCSALFDSE